MQRQSVGAASASCECGLKIFLVSKRAVLVLGRRVEGRGWRADGEWGTEDGE